MRPRLLAAIVAGAVALVLAIVLLTGGEDSSPPASASARLIPASALVALHLSTDADRPAVKRALKTARGFPSFGRLVDGLLGQLSAGGGGSGGVDFRRDIRPWLGNEATLALLDTRSATAGSLIVLDVADRGKADAFVARAAGRSKRGSYHGTAIRSYGGVATAYADGDLVIGQIDSVQAAIDLAHGRGRSLAADPTYRAATSTLPAGRVLDAYASAAGVRRLLAPQSGLLGIAGTLLDQPRLRATSLALSPSGDGDATVSVHSVLAKGGTRQFSPFQPSLAGSVPSTAMAYLGVAGLQGAAGRLLRSGLGASLGIDAGALLGRLGTQLRKQAGPGLQRDVLALFSGETAVWLSPAVPAPVLTVIARTKDEDATRETLAKLQGPVSQLFAVPSQGPGQTPTFAQRKVAGVQVSQLVLGPGVEFDYAVFGGKLVVSTALSGIRSVKVSKDHLDGSDRFDRVAGARPKQVTSLLFLDLSQLLRLGEQTGLGTDRAYLAVKGDLEKLSAIGAWSSGGETDTTAELHLQIS